MRAIARDDQPGMGQGRRRNLQARRSQHEHGLDSRGSPRRGQEAPGIGDVVDGQQDGARHRIRREMIEAVGDIDIGPLAHHHGSGQADLAPRGPGQDARSHGVGLRDQRERSRGKLYGHRGRVEAEAGRGDAER